MKRSSALGGPIAALLLSLCVVIAPSPASADTTVVQYSRGNVPAFIDLTRMRATNGAHRVRAVVHVRDLDDRGRFVLSFLHPRKGTLAVIEMGDAGPELRMLHEMIGDDSSHRVKCPGARVKWLAAKDQIDFSAPQQCLKWDFNPPPSSWRFRAAALADVDGESVMDRPAAVRVFRSS